MRHLQISKQQKSQLPYPVNLGKTIPMYLQFYQQGTSPLYHSPSIPHSKSWKLERITRVGMGIGYERVQQTDIFLLRSRQCKGYDSKEHKLAKLV